MKFSASMLSYFFSDHSTEQNVSALVKYAMFLVALIMVFATSFQILMTSVEGQDHSWLAGIYWTLTVMSTLGFGDITFHTDIGRLFSIVVLLSGIISLLVVLPFLFIRSFYAPWLEARIRFQAPRELPEETKNHVVLCKFDPLADDLIGKLRLEGIPYVVIEPDPKEAARLERGGIVVVTGEADSVDTHRAIRTDQARLVVVNDSDTNNTNITLTIREVSDRVPILATAAMEHSVDLLELSGANKVLPLKVWLGEQLASRVDEGPVKPRIVGHYGEQIIAELSADKAGWAGKTLGNVKLEQLADINVVGMWERGQLQEAHADRHLSCDSVAVLMGNLEKMERLATQFQGMGNEAGPVLIVGGGTVGSMAAKVMMERGIRVNLVERSKSLARNLVDKANKVVVGDAADLNVVMEAGLKAAPSAILSTNDDAMNIYLAVYLKRLNPQIRIISRMSHAKNFKALHRAGADFVLSCTSLGVSGVLSFIHEREPVILAEGVDLFFVPICNNLAGKKLVTSNIWLHTGLKVIAIKTPDGMVDTEVKPETVLLRGAELLMVGTQDQRWKFASHFQGHSPLPNSSL